MVCAKMEILTKLKRKKQGLTGSVLKLLSRKHCDTECESDISDWCDFP